MRMGIFWLGNILVQPGLSIYQQTHGERDTASWQRLGRMEMWIQTHKGKPYLEPGGHPGQLRDSGQPGSLQPKGAWSLGGRGAHTPCQTGWKGSPRLDAIKAIGMLFAWEQSPPSTPARCHQALELPVPSDQAPGRSHDPPGRRRGPEVHLSSFASGSSQDPLVLQRSELSNRKGVLLEHLLTSL